MGGLAIIAAFIVGSFFGSLLFPKVVRVEVPDVQVIESCNEKAITIQCPEAVKCDDRVLRQNFFLCMSTLKSFSEKLSEAQEAKQDCLQTIQTEREDKEYWHKKYVDFSCGE